MNNYAFLLSYLPSLKYSGFSKQFHDSTNILTKVAMSLKESRLLNSINNSNIKIASRTDRGVGALRQVFSLKCSQFPILTEINSYLPDDICILGVREVSSAFNPRYDANSRRYSYFLIMENFNIDESKKALQYLQGTHDFQFFSKEDLKNPTKTIRNLKSIELISHGDNTYQIRIESRSFLWHQVRRIVGHLIEISEGRYNSDHTLNLLNKTADWPRPPIAPSVGLILEDISYPDLSFKIDQKSLNNFFKTIKGILIDLKRNEHVYSFFYANIE
ncbi:tRNA pseudouridine synthase A [Candidatus Hodarchaeum mangrovi]